MREKPGARGEAGKSRAGDWMSCREHINDTEDIADRKWKTCPGDDIQRALHRPAPAEQS